MEKCSSVVGLLRLIQSLEARDEGCGPLDLDGQDAGLLAAGMALGLIEIAVHQIDGGGDEVVGAWVRLTEAGFGQIGASGFSS